MRSLWMLQVVAISILASTGVGMGYGQTLSMDGGLSNQVRSFAVDSANQRVLVGGGFRYAGIDSLLAKGLVAWVHDHWSMTDLGDGSGDTLPAWYVNYKILFDMVMFRDTLFCEVGHQDWHYDPALNDIIYLTDGDWHPCAMKDNYMELMECNGRLFGGGPASVVNGEPMRGVKEWVNGAWHAISNDVFQNSNSDDVMCATYWDNRYYFAGLFNASGAHKVVSWNGIDQWDSLGPGLGSNWVNAIAGYGDTLYAGGYLLETAEQPSRHMRMWDGSIWHPFFPEVQFVDQVWQMAVYDGALYIQGVHHYTGENTWYGLLRFDGHELCSIGGPVTGGGTDMTFYQDTLYYGLQAEFPGLEYQWIGRLPLNDLIPDRCVTVSTDIAESRSESTFKVYPNPVSEELTVQFGERKADQVVIMDATGRTIQELPVQGRTSMTIQATGLAPGSYAVRVSDDRGVRSAWFIKQ